jgi:hypothetical protein
VPKRALSKNLLPHERFTSKHRAGIWLHIDTTMSTKSTNNSRVEDSDLYELAATILSASSNLNKFLKKQKSVPLSFATPAPTISLSPENATFHESKATIIEAAERLIDLVRGPRDILIELSFQVNDPIFYAYYHQNTTSAFFFLLNHILGMKWLTLVLYSTVLPRRFDLFSATGFTTKSLSMEQPLMLRSQKHQVRKSRPFWLNALFSMPSPLVSLLKHLAVTLHIMLFPRFLSRIRILKHGSTSAWILPTRLVHRFP